LNLPKLYGLRARRIVVGDVDGPHALAIGKR
jgi:hypothetical protein